MTSQEAYDTPPNDTMGCGLEALAYKKRSDDRIESIRWAPFMSDDQAFAIRWINCRVYWVAALTFSLIINN